MNEVLSRARTSTFTLRMRLSCMKAKTRSSTPLAAQRLNRWYTLFHLPYSLGRVRHLYPFSAMLNRARMKVRLSISTFPRWTGRRGLMISYCSSVSCMTGSLTYFPNSVNTP